MNIGKSIIFMGIVLVVVGLIFTFFRPLPGDIQYKGEKFSVYFPVVTSIVVSIVLTILINVFIYFFRR